MGVGFLPPFAKKVVPNGSRHKNLNNLLLLVAIFVNSAIRLKQHKNSRDYTRLNYKIFLMRDYFLGNTFLDNRISNSDKANENKNILKKIIHSDKI